MSRQVKQSLAELRKERNAARERYHQCSEELLVRTAVLFVALLSKENGQLRYRIFPVSREVSWPVIIPYPIDHVRQRNLTLHFTTGRWIESHWVEMSKTVELRDRHETVCDIRLYPGQPRQLDDVAFAVSLGVLTVCAFEKRRHALEWARKEGAVLPKRKRKSRENIQEVSQPSL